MPKNTIYKADILPAGPLMKEHRVIEKMVKLIAHMRIEFKKTNKPDAAFISAAIDFLKYYADKCHHGKEEDILFFRLNAKQLSVEHKEAIERLLNDHRLGRKMVEGLEAAQVRYSKGDTSSFTQILARMDELAELYPEHIRIEDKEFFLPCMEYFSKEEQAKILEDFAEFDISLVHDKYREIVENLEKKYLDEQ